MTLVNRTLAAALGLSLLLTPGGARAQLPEPSKAELTTTKLADGLWMLSGGGGNVGVLAGPDGVVLIDAGLSELTDKLKAAVSKLSPAPIRFVVNTHWHPDHVGGNERWQQAGATVIAHENTRKAMGQRHRNETFRQDIPPSPAAAMPSITFADSLTLHAGNEELQLLHALPAHTGGDLIVHFREANVIHAGDNFQTSGYPFIDFASGGSIDGLIDVAEQLRKHADTRTRLIPGHGPAGGKADVKAYLDMLVAIRDRVSRLVRQRKTVEQVLAARPSADYDERWGKAFLTGEQFVRLVYESLTASGSRPR